MEKIKCCGAIIINDDKVLITSVLMSDHPTPNIYLLKSGQETKYLMTPNIPVDIDLNSSRYFIRNSCWGGVWSRCGNRAWNCCWNLCRYSSKGHYPR